MHDRQKIRDLYAFGVGPSEVARQVGCSRSTVYRSIDPTARIRYERAGLYSEAVERVREVIERYPLMPAPAVAVQADWPGSLRRLQEVIHPMRFPALERSQIAGVLIRPAQIAPANLDRSNDVSSYS